MRLAPPARKTDAMAGSWIVNTQVNPGRYRAENAPQGCEWQRLSAFTGTGDDTVTALCSDVLGGVFTYTLP